MTKHNNFNIIKNNAIRCIKAQLNVHGFCNSDDPTQQQQITMGSYLPNPQHFGVISKH
jgi:hypothetical protein